MGRKRKLEKTDDMLVDEILEEMDKLRDAGLDLSKIEFKRPSKPGKDADLYSQWDNVVADLKSKGANLNIPIVLAKG